MSAEPVELVALIVLLPISELFPLLHHGALAARRHLAQKSGSGDLVTTTQLQLLGLQSIAIVAVATVATIRAIRGLGVIPPGVIAPALFWMVFALGVYSRYPDAAPVAVSAPVWQVGFMRYMRWFWAGWAGLLAIVLAVAGVVARS